MHFKKRVSPSRAFSLKEKNVTSDKSIIKSKRRKEIDIKKKGRRREKKRKKHEILPAVKENTVMRRVCGGELAGTGRVGWLSID